MTPLAFSRGQMVREATLTEADLAEVDKCRRDHNRLAGRSTQAVESPFNADFHGRENNQSLRAQGPSFLGDLPHRATLWLIVFSAQSGSVGFVSTFSIS